MTLKAAPPLESPSSFVKMAPVIPISRLKVVTKAVHKIMVKSELGNGFGSHGIITYIRHKIIPKPKKKKFDNMRTINLESVHKYDQFVFHLFFIEKYFLIHVKE